MRRKSGAGHERSAAAGADHDAEGRGPAAAGGKGRDELDQIRRVGDMTPEELTEILRTVIREELAAKRETTYPVTVRQAAETAGVDYRWLLDRITRKELKAYRSGDHDPWRVYLKDVRELLTRQSNMDGRKRKLILGV